MQSGSLRTFVSGLSHFKSCMTSRNCEGFRLTKGCEFPADSNRTTCVSELLRISLTLRSILSRSSSFKFAPSILQFLITSLAFATFSVQRDLPQNRLQLSFTLVLTSVAFKFVVNQSLPKISYLTYLVSLFYLMFITWASCQIRKIVGCACARNAGNVFPATAS